MAHVGLRRMVSGRCSGQIRGLKLPGTVSLVGVGRPGRMPVPFSTAWGASRISGQTIYLTPMAVTVLMPQS